MKNPKRSNFTLNKVKLISGGGLALNFTLQQIIGADTYKDTQDHKSTKQPHPDLEELLLKLAPMVAQVFCFTNARDIVNRKEFDANISQKDYIAKYVDFIVEKIKITGISISGEDTKRGVVITALFAVDNNQRTAINTPRILLGGESRGFEEKLTELVDKLEGEVYEFVYEDKIANPEMFEYGDSEEEETEEEVEENE